MPTIGEKRRSIRLAETAQPTDAPTHRSAIVNRVLRHIGRRVLESGPVTAEQLVRVRRTVGRTERLVSAPRSVVVTPTGTGPGQGEWVRPHGIDTGKIVLYFHGGGYFFGSPKLYRGFAARLAIATGRAVFLAVYRLAPEHNPADALDDALHAYDGLRAQGYSPRDIAVGGDSAGGHLALTLVHALKRRGEELPTAVVAIAPWIDLSCSAQSHRVNDSSEYLLPTAKLPVLGRLFTDGRHPNELIFAPRDGDYSGFPPLMIIASSTEILRDDARELAATAARAGVDVVHQEWNDQVHVFPIFADVIPEGRAAIGHIADFLSNWSTR
ncbi:alpha/beta hydrolase [Nocardia sp. NPDC055049]